MAFGYPISLELQGRRCVVLGGGAVAEQKVKPLLEAGADLTIISPNFTDYLEELSRNGGALLIYRGYSPGDLDGAFLAVAATDDPSVHALIYKEAEERGVLLNAVDDIDHCHFAVPSIVRRGDLQIAISTGGKAPALSKRLRRQLERQFGDEYEELVEILGQARAEAYPSRPDFPTWAKRWEKALEHDLVGLIRDGKPSEAKRLVREALAGERGPKPPGKVFIVGAGPGDPGLITVKGREALDRADVVVYDRLVHPSLIEGKRSIYVGKAPGQHSMSQEEINRLLVRLARKGERVVRLKGGDPFVYGRGSEEAEALASEGIDFEVVPAPTSAVAALAYAGIPVTDRRFSSSVAIVTGHCTRADVDWEGMATSAETIVILMGLANLADITGRLIAGGLDPATPAAIVENGTLESQRVIVSTLAELPAAADREQAKAPAIVVIGEVVRLANAISWFDTDQSDKERGWVA